MINDKKLALELWKKIYGNQDIVKDISNNLIVKEEYDTGKRYSWSIEKYDEDFNDYYIANELFIMSRNKQDFFSFNNINYYIDKDENGNFFFNSKDYLIDSENIRNIDSYIKKQILDLNEKKYNGLLIIFKLLKKDYQKYLLNYFYDVAKKFDFINISYSKDINKLNIKILFEINISKILDLALIFSSSIPLLIYRLNNKYKNIFEFQNFVQKGKFFNIFIIRFTSKNNKFVLDKINLKPFYLMTFENKIFITENSFKELTKKYYSPNEFSLPLKISPIIKLYAYNYLNKNFISYLKIVKKDENKI